jgi:hypothetical protein
MSYALTTPVPDARGLGRETGTALRWRRTVGLTASVCSLWALSVIYVSALDRQGWDAFVRRSCGRVLRRLGIGLEAGGAIPEVHGPLLMVANHISCWIPLRSTPCAHAATCPSRKS